MRRTHGERSTWRLLSRPAGPRARGAVALPLVLLLAGGSVVLLLGHGAGSAALRLSDVGAWLASSSQGIVSHINGPSGRPDASVTVEGAKDHRLAITQDGASVLVTDTRTGVVSRIDPVGLALAERRTFGTGTTVVAGAGQAYVIDERAGRVSRIDPKTLDVLGTPIALGSATGGAGLAGDGTLWVALPGRGQLVPVRNGTAGTAVAVARPGDRLSLTIADGVPVAVNATDAGLVAVRDGRPAAPLRLPAPAGAGRSLLVAPSVDGKLVPILADGTTLLLADLAAGTVRAVDLGSEKPSNRLGAPIMAAGRVYVPDSGNGRLLVYATGPGRFDPPIHVASGPAELTVFVRNGTVWANDQTGSAAVMVRPDGSPQPVEKYAPDVAGTASTIPPRPLPTPSRPLPTPPATAPTRQPQPPHGSPAPPQLAIPPSPVLRPQSPSSTPPGPNAPRTPTAAPTPSPPPASPSPSASPPPASPSPSASPPPASPTPVAPPATSRPPSPAPTSTQPIGGSCSPRGRTEIDYAGRSFPTYNCKTYVDHSVYANVQANQASESLDDSGYMFAADVVWVVCQYQGRSNPVIQGNTNTWWLYTQGDDSRSNTRGYGAAWGYLPATAVSYGGQNEPIPGVPTCQSYY